jgi:hypothetical protein
MTDPRISLTVQMLEWIVETPRSYLDVLDVWKTSCPRLSIWEDACADGLLESEPGRDGLVRLTAKGQALLVSAVSQGMARSS